MKKTLFAILIVLLCFSFAEAQQVMIMKKKAAAGCTNSCSANTVFDSADGSYNDSTTMGTTDRTFAGQSDMVFGSAYCICKVSFVISAGGKTLSDKTFKAQIYDMDGASLNNLLGESAGVTGDNGWANAIVDFSFATSVSVDATTHYAVVITYGTVDTSNYPTIQDDSATATSGAMSIWNASKARVSSWTGYYAGMRVYRE